MRKPRSASARQRLRPTMAAGCWASLLLVSASCGPGQAQAPAPPASGGVTAEQQAGMFLRAPRNLRAWRNGASLVLTWDAPDAGDGGLPPGAQRGLRYRVFGIAADGTHILIGNTPATRFSVPRGPASEAGAFAVSCVTAAGAECEVSAPVRPSPGRPQ